MRFDPQALLDDLHVYRPDGGYLAAAPVQLAQIAAQREQSLLTAQQAAEQARLDEIKAAMADTASARGAMTALAQSGSAMQWAPAVVSFVVLTTFGVVMYAALTRGLPAGSETILNMLLGTLAAMATSTVAYWVGSSAGSMQKTDLLFRSTPPGAGGGAAASRPFGQ